MKLEVWIWENLIVQLIYCNKEVSDLVRTLRIIKAFY